MAAWEGLAKWFIVLTPLVVQPFLLAKASAFARKRGLLAKLRLKLRRAVPGAGRSPEPSEVGADEGKAQEEELTSRLLVARRIVYARQAVAVLWVFIAVRGACLSCVILIKSSAMDWIDTGHEIAVMVGLIATTFGTLFPKALINERSLPLIQWGGALFFSSVILIIAYAFTIRRTIAKAQTTLVLLSFSLAGLRLNFRSVALQNLFMSVSLIIAYSSPSSREATGTSPVVLATSEVVILLWRLAIVRWVSKMIEDSTHKEVEALFGKCQESAVSSLLDMMCDAVVDLDHDLVMKADYSKLSVMLMQDQRRSLQGVPFADLIAHDEDRCLLERVIALQQQQQQDPHNSEHAQLTSSMLTIRLLDALGNIIKVVIYHVPYRSAGGLVHHLIGLREDSNMMENGMVRNTSFSTDCLSPPWKSSEQVQQQWQRPQQQPHRCLPEAELCPEVANLIGRHSMERTSSVGESTLLPTQETIDVVAEQSLPIRFVSEELRERYGLHGSDRCFGELLGEHDSADFIGRALRMAESVRSMDMMPHIANFGYVQLVPTSLELGGPKCKMVDVYYPPPTKEPYCFSIKVKHKVQALPCPNNLVALSPRVYFAGSTPSPRTAEEAVVAL